MTNLNEKRSAGRKSPVVRFNLSGSRSATAFRAGDLTVLEATDTFGNPLTFSRIPPNRTGVVQAWMPIDAATHSFAAGLEMPESGELIRLATLRGEVFVDVATGTQVLEMPLSGDELETGSKGLLESRGISFFVKQDQRTLVVETNGQVLDVVSVELTGIDPTVVRASREIMKRSAWYQFDSTEEFPSSARIRITVATAAQRIKVPFELTNVTWPGGL